MNKKLLSLYSLKFNPFSPKAPTSALWSAPSIESFCWRIEQQIGEGGFALAIGDPGTGKSAALRILAEHLGNLRDVVVGVWVGPKPRWPIFIVSWAIFSRSHWRLTTDGPAPKLYGKSGSITSKTLCIVRSS